MSQMSQFVINESTDFDLTSSDNEHQQERRIALNDNYGHIWKMLSSDNPVDKRLIDLYKIS